MNNARWKDIQRPNGTFYFENMLRHKWLTADMGLMNWDGFGHLVSCITTGHMFCIISNSYSIQSICLADGINDLCSTRIIFRMDSYL